MAGDAPVVLKERADCAIALANRSRESLAVSHVRRQAEQKIRFGIAGVLTAESDLPCRAIRAHCRHVIVPITLELKSSVHGMRAVNDADVILEGNRGLMEN